MITDARGNECFPYELQWDSHEGIQSTILWATSDYHAELLLEDLKNTGHVVGVNITVQTSVK